MLTGLPADWARRTDGPGTWSAYDIVGHLVEAEAAAWLPRAQIILEYGTDRTFPVFDREGMLRRDREPVDALLARFRAARRTSLDRLAALGLTSTDLDRRGRHPEFGTVTLGNLLATWVAHDLTHLAQVAEVLARRHRTDVGPYRAYLPALDRVADAE